MSIKKKFILNTGIIGISKVFGGILSYIIIILLSREFGAYGLGVYSFGFALVGIFFILTNFGFDHLLIKDLAKDPSKTEKYLSNILSLKLIIFILLFIIYILVLPIINKNNILIILVITALIQGVSMIRYTFYSLLRVKNKGFSLSIIEISERLVSLILIYLVLMQHLSLGFFFISLFIGGILSLVISLYLSRKDFKLKLNLNFDFTKILFKKGFPFILIGIFEMIYMQMDSIMLSFMQSGVIVGFYNAGYKLIIVLNMIPAILLIFGYPFFSRLYVQNKEILKKLFEEILHYCMIIIIPIVVGVYYLASRILEAIYKFGSIESALAFKILIVAQIFIFLTLIMGQLISAVDKQHVFAKIAGFGALINLILNFLLIPKYSLYGAGFATLVTYFLIFLIMYIYIYRTVIKFTFFKKLVAPLTMGVVLFFVIPHLLHLNIFLIITISAAIYLPPLGLIEYFKWKKGAKNLINGFLK